GFHGFRIRLIEGFDRQGFAEQDNAGAHSSSAFITNGFSSQKYLSVVFFSTVMTIKCTQCTMRVQNIFAACIMMESVNILRNNPLHQIFLFPLSQNEMSRMWFVICDCL